LQKESKESKLWLKHILTYDDAGLEKGKVSVNPGGIRIRKHFQFYFEEANLQRTSKGKTETIRNDSCRISLPVRQTGIFKIRIL